MKLTQKTVTALTLDGKSDLIVFDDDVKGFGYRLRLSAGGKVLRSWVAQYRHGGATRRLRLGSAEVLRADDARTAAKKALGRVANGEDPQAHKLDRRGKDAHTLKASVADFLKIKEREVRPRTLREITRYLTDRRYFGPLHSLPLDQIGRKDVATRLNRISLESGSIVAGRARAQLSALFSWALAQGLCEANAVVGTLAPKGSQPRERVLSDAELAAIWQACGDDDYGRCIKLLICTGCRRQEIGGMCWREFDNPENPSTWTLPPSRSKNKRAHTLPLLPAMRDIIAAVPCMVGREQLFGTRGSGYSAWSSGKRGLDQRSGVKDWTTHDLRRSVATKLADLGVMPHIIEAALNHYSGHRRGVAGTYNRSAYEKEIRNALALWHDRLRTLVEGGVRKVVPIRP